MRSFCEDERDRRVFSFPWLPCNDAESERPSAFGIRQFCFVSAMCLHLFGDDDRGHFIQSYALSSDVLIFIVFFGEVLSFSFSLTFHAARSLLMCIPLRKLSRTVIHRVVEMSKIKKNGLLTKIVEVARQYIATAR